jgi:hypothetical protein
MDRPFPETDVTADTPTWPELVPERFFAGPVRGHGCIESRGGAIKTEFVVDMYGAWQGNVFVIDETFVFRDGKRSLRKWRIHPSAPGRYTGEADDFVGIAHGEAAGNFMRWRFTLLMPVGARTIALRFDDRCHLQPDGVLLNVSDAYKFSLRVARLTATMRRM